MSKQDLQGVRTPADVEQKYNLGNLDKTFAEIMGIATDARNSVESASSTLRSEFGEQMTTLTRNTEAIVMSALEEYTKTSDLETFRSTVESELQVMAETISMNFEATVEQVTNVNGDLQTVIEDLQKHFVFGVDGLTIKAGESQLQLRIDNDVIAFYKGDIDEADLTKNRFGWWDGVNFHTGNIYVGVDEVAQFGNYGFVAFEDEETDGLDLVRVGG